MLTFPFNTDVRFTLIPMVGGVKIEQSDMENLTVRIENKNRGVLFDPKWDITDKGIEIEIQREKIPFATSYNVVAEWRRPDSSFFDGYQDIHHSCNAIEFKKDCSIQCGNGVLMVEASQCYKGTPGVGVPKGGAPGQALVKKTSDDFDTEWKTLSTGTGTGDGKTPVIGSITAESIPSTEAPSFSLTHTSNDGEGNPIYTGTIKIPKGKNGVDGDDGNDGDDGTDGKTPVFEIGTVETLSAGSQATASITANGIDAQGNPKYKVNFGIPKGANGTGDGSGTTNPEWADIEGKPSWIGATKPTYTASEVGALPTEHNADTEAHGGIAAKVSTLESKVQTLENTETVTANLEIKKIYSSIAVMESDFSTTDVAFGEFVAIESNDDDNGSLFIKNTSNWGYMGKVGQSAGDSYIPNNLIDFSKIVIGKKVTSVTVNNTTKTYSPVLEDNQNYAYIKIDTTGKSGKCVFQGMRNDDSGNNYSRLIVALNNGNLYGPINPSDISDNYANDLLKKIYSNFENSTATGRVALAMFINIPIDTAEKLANINPETSELTLYAGWEHKEFDAKGVKPSVFIERTRNLADKRYLLRGAAGEFFLGYIPVKQGIDYLICGLHSSQVGAVAVYDENYTNVGNILAYNLKNMSDVQRITGRYGGYFNVNDFPAAKYVTVKLTNYTIAGIYDFVRNNPIVIQERKYGFVFSGIFEPVKGVSREEFESANDFLPANKRLSKLLNLAFVGDSITSGNWYSYMKNHLQINTLQNQSLSGISWTSSTMASYFANLIKAYKDGNVKGINGDTVSAPDYVFVFLGTNNDAVAGDNAAVMAKNIGDLSPTASRSEAIRYNMDKLRESFPSTTLVMFTPYQSLGGHEATRTKCQHIEDMANRLSIRCYNLFNELGIDPLYESSTGGRYLADSVHLNENGKALLSKYAAQIIKSLEI